MQGASDTTMNIVAALGAGLAGPVMALFGFTGLNAAAVMPVALVLLLAAIAARTRTENTSTPAPE